jgi:hypothetical protein
MTQLQYTATVHTGPQDNRSRTDGNVLVLDEQGVTICRCYQQPHDTWTARDNALLIAASPKLLEALQIAEVFVSASFLDQENTPNGKAVFEGLETIRAAIAEAEPPTESASAIQSDIPADQVDTQNKHLVFDILAQLAIDTVVVCFDGSGDSGQIDAIDAFDADRNEVPLPSNRKVHLPSPIAGAPPAEITLREAIETLAYDHLGMSWADNDGAFGKFVFSVVNRSITLEFNERFTDFRTQTEEF